MCCFPNIWKVLPETMTLSTMRFFPAHDGMKSALTMRENLPFLVKSVLRSKNYIELIAASNENLRGSGRKKAYLQSGLSKNAKQVRRSARCALPSIRRISSAFYVQENTAAVLRLLMRRGCAFVHSAGEVRAAFFEKPIRLICSQPVLPFRFCPYRRLKSQISASYAENDVYNSLKLEKNC